jgi:hypothetical protein
MTATYVPTNATATRPTTDERTTPLWRTGARAGLVAAAATTAVAAAAMGADVPLEVDGEQIPLLGFAQLTMVCTAVGVLLAKVLSRRTFVAVTLALTALSFVPDLTIEATTATRVVLVATHVVAAAAVVPALAERVPARRR